MAYSAEIDLNYDERLLIQLTEKEAAIGVKDAALIAQLGDRASDRVDAELTGTYVTPVVPTPAILKEIAADFHRYLLWRHRPAMEMPDDVMKSFDRGIKQLQKFVQEKNLPGATLRAAATEPGPSGAAIDAGERIFGRGRDRLG